MIRLDDWTIIKIDDNESYIIGVSEEGRTIHTTTIYKLDYLHNDFVIVRTQNNTYKLYFEDQFVPTEVDRELTQWKFEKNDKYLKCKMTKNMNIGGGYLKHPTQPVLFT